jgi:hypothetical protein
MPKGIPRALDDQHSLGPNASEVEGEAKSGDVQGVTIWPKPNGQRFCIVVLQVQPLELSNICHNLGELQSSEIVY